MPSFVGTGFTPMFPRERDSRPHQTVMHARRSGRCRPSRAFNSALFEATLPKVSKAAAVRADTRLSQRKPQPVTEVPIR
jgi:hypothetical protein